MKSDVQFDFLECNECHSKKPLIYSNNGEGEVLKCEACQRSFPYRNQTVFMVTKERDADTLKKFEYQWKTWGGDTVLFGKTSEDYQDKFLTAYKNPKLDTSWFRGKRCLDAGCGHGIMVEVFERLGAQSVGLELGDGVFKAAHRLKDKRVQLVQGDILDIPFRNESFDYVYCNGVIHHTRDTRLAFKKLAAIVKKGGGLDIWVYPKKGFLWEYGMGFARFFTTKLPPFLLKPLCYLAVPLLYVVPAWSGTHPSKNSIRQCAQVIYDWLSPKYQTHHTFEEVRQWYIEEGFENIGENTQIPLSVYGIKRSV